MWRISRYDSRDLFASLNVFRCEKCDFRKTQILMFEIHTNRNRIRFTRMIQETTHISIEIGIDAMLWKNSLIIYEPSERWTHKRRKKIVSFLPLMHPNRRNNCHRYDDRLQHRSIFRPCIRQWRCRVIFYSTHAHRIPWPDHCIRIFAMQLSIHSGRHDFCTAIYCSRTHRCIRRSSPDHGNWNRCSGDLLHCTNSEWIFRCTDNSAWYSCKKWHKQFGRWVRWRAIRFTWLCIYLLVETWAYAHLRDTPINLYWILQENRFGDVFEVGYQLIAVAVTLCGCWSSISIFFPSDNLDWIHLTTIWYVSADGREEERTSAKETEWIECEIVLAYDILLRQTGNIPYLQIEENGSTAWSILVWYTIVWCLICVIRNIQVGTVRKQIQWNACICVATRNMSAKTKHIHIHTWKWFKSLLVKGYESQSTHNGVSPLIFCEPNVEPPCWRNNITVSILSDSVAQCNAVLFSESQILGFAPQLSRALTISALPKSAAQTIAVHPPSSLAFKNFSNWYRLAHSR